MPVLQHLSLVGDIEDYTALFILSRVRMAPGSTVRVGFSGYYADTEAIQLLSAVGAPLVQLAPDRWTFADGSIRAFDDVPFEGDPEHAEQVFRVLDGSRTLRSWTAGVWDILEILGRHRCEALEELGVENY